MTTASRRTLQAASSPAWTTSGSGAMPCVTARGRASRQTDPSHFATSGKAPTGPRPWTVGLTVEDISSIRAETVALTVDAVDIVSAAGVRFPGTATSGRRPRRAHWRASELIFAQPVDGEFRIPTTRDCTHTRTGSLRATHDATGCHGGSPRVHLRSARSADRSRSVEFRLQGSLPKRRWRGLRRRSRGIRSEGFVVFRVRRAVSRSRMRRVGDQDRARCGPAGTLNSARDRPMSRGIGRFSREPLARIDGSPENPGPIRTVLQRTAPKNNKRFQ